MSINDKKRLLDYIYRSRGNLLDMLDDRNYITKKLRNYSYDILTSFYDKHEQGKFTELCELSPLDFILNHKNNNTRVLVKYRLDDKFKNTGKLKKLVNNIYEYHKLNENDTVIILVVNAILVKVNKLDNPAFSFSEEFRIQNKFVQVFGLENLLINISKHSFVPKHIILTDDEVKDVCDKYNIVPSNLHKILIQDPMARFIGLRPGQVVKINTISPITGITPSYRICVNKK
jgi:DNA-directed RNA polymerase I, II, and III subunit RPABC1